MTNSSEKQFSLNCGAFRKQFPINHLHCLFLLSLAVFFAGCASGPSPAEIQARERQAKRQAEVSKMQSEIRQGTAQCSLPKEKIAQIAELIKQADAIVKKSPDSSFAFDEATGIVTFTCEDIKWQTSVAYLGKCVTLRDGVSSASYTDSTGKTVSAVKYGPRIALWILTVYDQPVVWKHSTSKKWSLRQYWVGNEGRGAKIPECSESWDTMIPIDLTTRGLEVIGAGRDLAHHRFLDETECDAIAAISEKIRVLIHN